MPESQAIDQRPALEALPSEYLKPVTSNWKTSLMFSFVFRSTLPATVAKLKTRIEEAPPVGGSKLSGLPRVVPLPLPSSETTLRLILFPALACVRSRLPLSASLS